jgi:teichuronic acid biosynthesis protein TuaF
MSFMRNETFSRILKRLKKLFFILLLIPIILAALGYFIESNQKTTTNATAAIMLGNVNSQEKDFTDTGTVQELFKSEKYLKELKKEYNLSYNPAELAEKTNPTIKPGKIIELSYSSNSKEKADTILKELVDAFLLESNKNYESQKKSLEDSIKNPELNDTTDQASLIDLEDKLTKLRPTEIHKEVALDETNNNPVRRAILGFLIGVMFSISILLFPEIIRK